MNQEKMGKFIAELRKSKNLTQQELADLIPVTREAVSKWERGKRCPDPQVLVKLSEIFEVTINELLYGEEKNKENNNEIKNISLNFYQEKLKVKKVIKILIGIIFLILVSFLTYYFIITYNSLKTYLITYDGEKINLEEGILVMTNEELYFNLGHVITSEPLKSLDLFYKDKNGEDVWIISFVDDSTIIFTDFNGYNRYID